jgi:hypothetical protein
MLLLMRTEVRAPSCLLMVLRRQEDSATLGGLYRELGGLPVMEAGFVDREACGGDAEADEQACGENAVFTGATVTVEGDFFGGEAGRNDLGDVFGRSEVIVLQSTGDVPRLKGGEITSIDEQKFLRDESRIAGEGLDFGAGGGSEFVGECRCRVLHDHGRLRRFVGNGSGEIIMTEQKSTRREEIRDESNTQPDA